MNPEAKMVVLLLFLPPMIGELLSGSSPPLSFFSGGIIFLVLLYGCGTLLIREAKARWDLQWSIIFLVVAYGIIEEGTMVQSFFNVGHVDLGALSGYGMYGGVQWPWSIGLTVYHATISTLVPLVMVEYLYPGYKDIPVLKRRGTALCLAGFIFVIVFWLVVGIFLKGIPMYDTYHFSYALNSATLLVVAILIWLAYKFKTSKVSSKTHCLSPVTFGFIGFWIMVINLFIPHILAEMQIFSGITIFVQLIWVTLLLLFLFYQVYNEHTTKRHIVSLVSGFLLFFIALTPLQEVGMAENPDPTAGMLAVGIVAFGLLIIWRRTVLRGENSPPDMRVLP